MGFHKTFGNCGGLILLNYSALIANLLHSYKYCNLFLSKFASHHWWRFCFQFHIYSNTDPLDKIVCTILQCMSLQCTENQQHEPDLKSHCKRVCNIWNLCPCMALNPRLGTSPSGHPLCANPRVSTQRFISTFCPPFSIFFPSAPKENCVHCRIMSLMPWESWVKQNNYPEYFWHRKIIS